MAKKDIELLRGVRMPATRSEGGKVVQSGAVITEAEDLDKATLSRVAEKGYVAGMEPAVEDAGEESAPKTSGKKSASKK